jgi:queuine tRNA-ribosyltransferase
MSDIGQRYSRAYLHHLIKAKEMIGPQILVEHNITFMNRLMVEIRQAIARDSLAVLRAEWMSPVSDRPAVGG